MTRITAIEKVSFASASPNKVQSGGFLSPSSPAAPSSFPGGVTEHQALWMSFRAQARSDSHATQLLNQALILDPPLTDAQVNSWWSQDSFCDLAAGVINVPTTAAFLRLAESTLFPTAYRALYSMLNSSNMAAKGKGLDLLFRLHGMLIDRVQHDAPAAIESIAESLRTLTETVTLEVYTTAPAEPALEGEWNELTSDDE